MCSIYILNRLSVGVDVRGLQIENCLVRYQHILATGLRQLILQLYHV
jgi:hypothetical protein